MKKYCATIFLSVILLFAVAYGAYWYSMPYVSPQYLSSQIPAELENKIFHWRYDIGWAFKAQMRDEALFLEGIEGEVKGKKAKVKPHITRIQHGIYFVSWAMPVVGVESLVIDFINNKIHAHSKANAKLISSPGQIHCNGLIQICSPPRV